MSEARRPRLTHRELDRIRGVPRRSLLLFITDRCPVGCLHCSVDSRPDSAMIQDFDLFDGILKSICSQAAIEVVGISGGEPFVEKRGLQMATQKLAAAGKRQVVFTSGTWAGRSPPRWILDVLRETDCVYLSTDGFHLGGVDGERFMRAACTIAAAGSWIVVQVLDHEGAPALAADLLERAFGSSWRDSAEINLIKPLRHGRGASHFAAEERWSGQSFGRCRSLTSPVVRYDGLVTACCNESVIMGLGPRRLQQEVADAESLPEALEALREDPLLRVIEAIGFGAVTADERFEQFAERKFDNICQLCWKVFARAPARRAPERVLNAFAMLEAAE